MSATVNGLPGATEETSEIRARSTPTVASAAKPGETRATQPRRENKRFTTGKSNGFRIGQDLREFEVDQAEAAHLGGIGHVARLGVEVANAVILFQVGEQFIGAFLADLVRQLAATGCSKLNMMGGVVA